MITIKRDRQNVNGKENKMPSYQKKKRWSVFVCHIKEGALIYFDLERELLKKTTDMMRHLR